MSTVQERSRYYALIDTGDWDDLDIVSKAVYDPASLTLAEKLKWRAMCAKLGIDPNI